MLRSTRIVSCLGLVCLLSLTCGAREVNDENGSDLQVYPITTTWDNRTEPDKPVVTLYFQSSTGSEAGIPRGLRILVEAPYYNNTAPDGQPGFFDGLWDYEVVEVFFLGPNETYLEVELGPHGHYLTYFLEGVRNVTNKNLPLDHFQASIVEGESRWTGSAVIPLDYLPQGVNLFNAYAIHNLGDSRRYLALFPVPFNDTEYPEPDFHRLEFFGDLDLSTIIENANGATSLGAGGLLFGLLSVFVQRFLAS